MAKEIIACVVPTIRPESYQEFLVAWKPLFDKHNVQLVTVFDGDDPTVKFNDETLTANDVLGDDADLIYNKSDVVRNLGFAYIAKYLPGVTHILTLDDDTKPYGDTIQDHLNVLGKRASITWMNTATLPMRGFPYGVRTEAEVVLSHGVWQGVADWDAPTQLIQGNRQVTFYRGVIPKGALYPMCGMNIMFTRKLLPYMYFAPMGHRVGLDRFGDIWAGVESKKVIDEKGWAVVSGYATVKHERASDVFKNLQKEAKGLEMNEHYGEDECFYFKLYEAQRTRWETLLYDLDHNAGKEQV